MINEEKITFVFKFKHPEYISVNGVDVLMITINNSDFFLLHFHLRGDLAQTLQSSARKGKEEWSPWATIPLRVGHITHVTSQLSKQPVNSTKNLSDQNKATIPL